MKRFFRRIEDMRTIFNLLKLHYPIILSHFIISKLIENKNACRTNEIILLRESLFLSKRDYITIFCKLIFTKKGGESCDLILIIWERIIISQRIDPTLGIRNEALHFVSIVSKFIANWIDVALIISGLDDSWCVPIERKPITNGLLYGFTRHPYR